MAWEQEEVVRAEGLAAAPDRAALTCGAGPGTKGALPAENLSAWSLTGERK